MGVWLMGMPRPPVMSQQELQEEEREVLVSIYGCDECFKQSSDTSFSYRVGEAGEAKSFLVEIQWGESYPDELPTISLDAFFNNHLNTVSKDNILKTLTEEADGLLGTAMTYSLFELAKEKADEMIVDIPEIVAEDAADRKSDQVVAKAKKEKKEILSKQQKRRLADRCNAQGERPRGWNWVDVVKVTHQLGMTQLFYYAPFPCCPSQTCFLICSHHGHKHLSKTGSSQQ